MAENYLGLTDTGRVRSNNEDAFIAQKIFHNRLILGCVIDGVGGYAGGEVAAAIAKETIVEVFSKESANLQAQMRQAFSLANERIAAAKQTDKGNDSMACVLTLVIADLEQNQFLYAHVGDTRLYLFRDASLIKVSKDHSFVGFLEDSGRLSEDAAMQHPKRNEINKALGFAGTIANGEDYIETGESPFLPGDLLLLCSDGLTDMVNKADITATLALQTSLENKAAQLIAAANEKGGKDNITVALIYHDKAPVKQKATKPPALKKNEIQKAELRNDAPRTSIASEIKRSGRNNIIITLSIVSILLLAGLCWALWKLSNSTKEEPLVAAAPVGPNTEEQRLQLLINNSVSDTVTVYDSLFSQPLRFTDAIIIDRPSLYLKGLGDIILTPDSSYKGPALLVTANNKSLVIDSLLFENFSVVIGTVHKNISLKNVRFNQCDVAVASYTTFPEILYINGALNNGVITVDSLPKSLK